MNYLLTCMFSLCATVSAVCTHHSVKTTHLTAIYPGHFTGITGIRIHRTSVQLLEINRTSYLQQLNFLT